MIREHSELDAIASEIHGSGQPIALDLETAIRNSANRLWEVADRYLGIALRKDTGRSDWGTLMLLAEQIQYAAENVEHLHALEEKLNAELKAAALMEVFRLEMDLLSNELSAVNGNSLRFKCSGTPGRSESNFGVGTEPRHLVVRHDSDFAWWGSGTGVFWI